MKVTIAGANSFIGKRMVAYADTQPDIELTLVMRKGSFIDLSGIKHDMKKVECDMEDYAKLGEIAGEGDCFIDLSWIGSRGEERKNPELQRFNYLHSMEAMRSMAEAEYRILVSAGSQAEYGSCSGLISEETPLSADTEYGKYKAKIFYECAEFSKLYGIRFIEPRYFSLYGPGDYQKTLVMSCIDKMCRGADIELNECTQLWDYLYVDDAVEGVFSLIRNESALGAYNFATGDYRMIREFVMDIHKAVESTSKVHFGSPGSTFKGPVLNLRPVIDKLKRDGNWTPKISFEEGIRKTAETFR